MKKHITRTLMSLALVAAMVAVPLVVAPDFASAATDTARKACEGVQASGGGACTGGQLENFLRDIVNILLFVIGTISVIMIIVGGLRYVLSGGDANSITAGKNTVLYAIIGLVVSIMAYAIVNFVIGSL